VIEVRGQKSGVSKSTALRVVLLELGLIGVVLLSLSFPGDAQQQPKIPRIAFLAGGSRSADSLLIEAFWQQMKNLGYIEGKNIAAEYRFAEGAPEQLRNLTAEVVRSNVDVIVAPGSGARAAKNVTNTIPIVLTYGDPVGQGLVASLARPGGNVTGLSGFASELGGKQLELLKEAFPRISRVAVLWWQQNELVLGELKAAARPLQVTLQTLEVRVVNDFEPAFSAIKDDRAQALLVIRNPLTVTHRGRIVDFAAKNRLPAMYGDREFVDVGGLMSYGVDIADLWGRAAFYVDKILKGAKPADLPVEQPKKFELFINLNTAKQLGLTIPPNVLARADKVIK
jgi:putative ABC transport system substrate-binding protein